MVEIDLSTINTGNITATAKVLPFVSTEVGVGQLTSLVMEGGLPYIVATDSVNKSILAIDQYTGESVYLLQTTAPAVVE